MTIPYTLEILTNSCRAFLLQKHGIAVYWHIWVVAQMTDQFCTTILTFLGAESILMLHIFCHFLPFSDSVSLPSIFKWFLSPFLSFFFPFWSFRCFIFLYTHVIFLHNSPSNSLDCLPHSLSILSLLSIYSSSFFQALVGAGLQAAQTKVSSWRVRHSAATLSKSAQYQHRKTLYYTDQKRAKRGNYDERLSMHSWFLLDQPTSG